MDILKYLFLISVSFTVFEFIWGIFKFLFNTVTARLVGPGKSNPLRVIKYILFTAVSVQFVQSINADQALIGSSAASIIISSLIMGLYLLGKYQNRLALTQIRNLTNQFSNGFSNKFNPELEKFLILGAIIAFVIGSLFPNIVNNSLTQWFTASTINIYDTPFFGFIFKIIAVFILINSISRGSKILGKLISGQSFADATVKEKSNFSFFTNQNLNRSQFKQEKQEETEFADYEDVTDKE